MNDPKSYITRISVGNVVSLINFIQGKTDHFQLNIEYYRVGKTRAFLDEIENPEELFQWSVHEVQHLTDIYIPKQISELTDAYVLNIDIDEDNLEEYRRTFWNHLIWGDLPPFPLALVIPEKKKIGSLSKTEVLSGLSLIRLTDRPWEVFENKVGIEKEISDWLRLSCLTFSRGMDKKPLLKALEKEKKAQSS